MRSTEKIFKIEMRLFTTENHLSPKKVHIHFSTTVDLGLRDVKNLMSRNDGLEGDEIFRFITLMGKNRPVRIQYL